MNLEVRALFYILTTTTTTIDSYITLNDTGPYRRAVDTLGR